MILRQLTHGKDGVICYLDDILIYHTNPADHIRGVRLLLHKIKEFGLTSRPNKRFVASKKVTFSGYSLKHGKKIKILKTKKQVRSLLGLIKFYRDFVLKYFDIEASLTIYPKIFMFLQTLHPSKFRVHGSTV